MAESPASRRVARRIVVAGLVLASAAVAYGALWEPAQLVERDYTLALPAWPARCNGLRIDVIADTHTGSPLNGLDNLDRVVARLIDSDAPVVLMAGDYVILSVLGGTQVSAEAIAQHLKPLVARKQVYAVLGNHDWWKDGHRVSAAFAAAGVTMLDNRAWPVQAGTCRFWVAGIGDLLEGHPDVAGSFSQVSDDAPVIALTHEPDLFPRIPVRAALTIAGHTHGGQIDPWSVLRSQPGPFVAGSRLLRGEIRDRGRVLFVTPGIGTSIAPLRIGVLPEISRLQLRSASRDGAVY